MAAGTTSIVDAAFMGTVKEMQFNKAPGNTGTLQLDRDLTITNEAVVKEGVIDGANDLIIGDGTSVVPSTLEWTGGKLKGQGSGNDIPEVRITPVTTATVGSTVELNSRSIHIESNAMLVAPDTARVFRLVNEASLVVHSAGTVLVQRSQELQGQRIPECLS